METKDAWILVAGAILGFIGSLLATFTSPSIGRVFGKLKSGFIERNKTKALAAYIEVRDLSAGKRDKYLYAINSWGFMGLFLASSFMAGVVGIATGAIMRSSGTNISDAHRLPGLLLGLSFVIIALFLFLRRAVRLVLTLERVENFERYRNELLKRWPDLVLPE
jgi:hypothetical protein